MNEYEYHLVKTLPLIAYAANLYLAHYPRVLLMVMVVLYVNYNRASLILSNPPDLVKKIVGG